jgi:hypothetical protein
MLGTCIMNRDTIPTRPSKFQYSVKKKILKFVYEYGLCGQKIYNERETLHVLTAVGMAVRRGFSLRQADPRKVRVSSILVEIILSNKTVNCIIITNLQFSYRVKRLEKVAVLHYSQTFPFFY